MTIVRRKLIFLKGGSDMLEKIKSIFGKRVSSLWLEHERLTRELAKYRPDSKEYKAINTERHKIKEDMIADVRTKVDKSTVFKTVAFGAMLLFVLKYEETGIIKSKLWSPLSGMFFRGV